jgi:hypothetical protein
VVAGAFFAELLSVRTDRARVYVPRIEKFDFHRAATRGGLARSD